MPNFRYKAIGPAGDTISGEKAAQCQSDVIAWLRQAGNFPLRADELKHGGFVRWLNQDVVGARGVTSKQITLITRELSTLLGAGVPLERALQVLGELTKPGSLQTLLTDILEEVRGGSSFSKALEAQDGVFTALYVNLVRAGESGGALESVLANLADSLERSQALANSVRSALVYPLILLLMTGVSIVILLTIVIPQFEPLFDEAGTTLPLITRFMISGGDFISSYWWALVTASATAVWVFHRQLRVPAFRTFCHSAALKLPLYGDLIKKLQAARFARTLGTLVQNGITVHAALPIVRETMSNVVFVATIDQLVDRLSEGNGLSSPLDESGVFPQLATQLLRVGEETGELEPMLARIADIYDKEVATTLERLVAIIVPLLTIGLGLIVAALVGSIMLTVLNLNELAF